MAEADLAGIADQDDEAGHRKPVDEDQRADAEIIGGREEDRRDRDDRHEDEDEEREIALLETGACHTRSVDLRPNRPCGMAKSTARMTTKASSVLVDAS
jgi:hypothetical protein